MSEEPFLKILSKSSRPQIELIKAAYQKRRNHTLEKCIQKEFSGKIRDALLGALQDPLDLLCTKLREAFKGLGTDESTVTRIIGGFDQDGVRELAQRYQQKYDRSLAADIESELGGNLRKAVLRWIEGKDCTEGLYRFTQAPLPSDAAGLEQRVQQLTDEQAALRRCLAGWDTTLVHRACKGLGTDEQVLVRSVDT